MKKIKAIVFSALPITVYSVFGVFLLKNLQNFKIIKTLALGGLILSVILFIFQKIIKDKHYYPFAGLLAFSIINFIILSTSKIEYLGALKNNTFIGLILKSPLSVIFFSLFVVTFIPPILGMKPFTDYYARMQTEDAYTKTRLYKWVNNLLTFFWALLFLTAFFLQFLKSPKLKLILPLLIFSVIGIPGTILLKKYLLNVLPNFIKEKNKDFLKTAYEAIKGMPAVFNKKEAKDINLKTQFNITGEETFKAALKIKDGKCVFMDGEINNPDLTFNSPSDVYLSVAKGEISGDEAFLKQLYEIEGDTENLVKFQKLFQPSVNGEEKSSKTVKTTLLKSRIKYESAEPGEIKTVLALQASPRTSGISKTDVLLKKYLEGCKEAGAKVETIYLKDKTINPCIGCYNCWTKTPGKCIYNDDMEELLEKQHRADLTVFATPLYNFTMYSKLKIYIERFLPTLEPYLVEENGMTFHPIREKYKDTKKYVVLLGVCGFPEIDNFAALSQNFVFMSTTYRKHGNKILGEIYRGGSETINNPFFGDENERVLSLVKQAGELTIKQGNIPQKILDEIAEVKADMHSFHKQANMFWDFCIKNKQLPSEVQKNFKI